MKNILKAIELGKSFGSKLVVKNASIHLEQGEIMGLLGPNGAGKTTTFYMLTGIIRASKGQVLFNETNITNWALHRRARIGISYLPQESSIFKSLTVRQNLQIILEYMKISKAEQKERADRLLEEFGLTRLENSLASYLSGGERRRLEISRCLVHDPAFLLLDEPFAGIDPLAVDDIQELILSLKKKQIGILISDHNVRETLSICDRASLMYEGNLILSGTPNEIINNEQARSIYLGTSFSM